MLMVSGESSDLVFSWKRLRCQIQSVWVEIGEEQMSSHMLRNSISIY